MTGYGCLNCADCDSVLLPIREEAPKRRALYLCDSCYDDYRHGYIGLYICDSCNMEFMSDNDEGPSTCRTCITASNPILIESSLEDYEQHGYLNKKKNPVNTASCVRKLLNLYVAERQIKETKSDVRDRAMTFFKISKELPDNVIVVAEMARIARSLNMKPMEYFLLMADYDRTDEGLDELISVVKEEGYLVYDALQKDNAEEIIYERPCSAFYQGYLKQHPPSICLEEDDQYADVAF